MKNIESGQATAVSPDQQGNITFLGEIPSDNLLRRQTYFKELRKYIEVEVIYTVQSIDWGFQHCVFVDKKNRVFTFGQKRYGKLGSDEQPGEESEWSESSKEDGSEEHPADFKDDLLENLVGSNQDLLKVNQDDKSRKRVSVSGTSALSTSQLTSFKTFTEVDPKHEESNKKEEEPEGMAQLLIKNQKEEWQILPKQIENFAKPG